MSIFKRSRSTSAPAAAGGTDDARKLPAWPTQSYPATDEQLKIINGIVQIIMSARATGEITPNQVAGISVLCERIVTENEALSTFVDDLRQVAEAQRRPDRPGWEILANELQ